VLLFVHPRIDRQFDQVLRQTESNVEEDDLQ